MYIRILLTCTLVVALFSGCSTMVTTPRPMDYYQNVPEVSPPSSLFSGDSAVLSDEDIQKILSYRYVPVAHNRIAIMPLGDEYRFRWSDELGRVGDEVQAGLITALLSSPKVYDASYLPSFLIPEKKTVPLFREAAARYQADLLLIYHSSCRTYEKYRLLRSDTTKAYCNVEAILLDVRTGIIPFTAVASRDYSTDKKTEDINFQETIKKAELQALGEALNEVGISLTQFLEFSSRGDNFGKTSISR